MKNLFTSTSRAAGTLAVIVLVASGIAPAAEASVSTASSGAIAAAGPDEVENRPSPVSARGPRDALITCTPKVHHPHNSGHVPGTINVVVEVRCTAQVARIRIWARLYRDRTRVSVSDERNVHNTWGARNNAATDCRDGKYKGWIRYAVDFPLRFRPGSGESNGMGRLVRIVCP
ncbi:hypothetical protein ABT256_34480 [Amycolatopsis japonica]|uniref:hypothetical protein n=1 Tax=Amycolatopsis japonica TaxID=208439 RepID=UPI0033266E00